MSQEKKAAQTIEVTEEEAQQAIADIDLILNDPEMARKFTRNLLELGGLKDKPSQERLKRVHAEFGENFFVVSKILDNNPSNLIKSVGHIIFCMLETLYTPPTADGMAHAALLKRHIGLLNNWIETEPLAQDCLEDCLKLFSRHCNIEINALLQFAITSDALEIAKLLVRQGADIWKVTDSTHPPRSEKSPLYLAVASETASANFVQWLLEEGASTAYFPGSNSPHPSQIDKQFIVADYTAKKYTPAMVPIEDNIEELRRSLKEEANPMREAVITELLSVSDVVDIVSSYIVRGRDEALKDQSVEDKAVEKKDTVQPIPDKRVLPIQWVRQKLRELAELIPVKTSQAIPAIEAEKNKVLKVLTSAFLQKQCEEFWRDLKTARKEDKPLSKVLPPGTITAVAESEVLPSDTTRAVAESKSTQVIVSKNPFAIDFSGGHDAQDTPTDDNLATPLAPKDNGPKI